MNRFAGQTVLIMIDLILCFDFQTSQDPSSPMAGTSNPLTTSLNMIGTVNDTRDGWDNEDWGSLEEVPVSAIRRVSIYPGYPGKPRKLQMIGNKTLIFFQIFGAYLKTSPQKISIVIQSLRLYFNSNGL